MVERKGCKLTFINVEQWLKRLEDNFSSNGIVGEHLFEIFDLEKKCGESFVNTYHGQSVLIDSFQSFYIETIRSAYRWIAQNGWPKGSDHYSTILVSYVVNFRSFRACENLLMKGYPLDGYALLRDLKDRAVFLGAIANNITTFRKIYYGYANDGTDTEKLWKKQKNERKKEESRVFGRMLREDSGLPEKVIIELRKWEQLFHEEVHSSRMSFVYELREWLRNNVPPSLGPTPIEDPMAMYMNRAVEIGWMLVKLLPFIQPTENAFGARWKERQEILDDSFRIMELGLSHVGKKIADAFICFVEKKFSFPRDFCYFEADGIA